MLNILRKSNLYSKFFVVSLFVSLTFCSKAKPMVLSQKEIKSPPSRIIRTCCSFGSNLHILSIEKIKINDVSSIDRVGPHKYLGNTAEGNGIVYTKLGGFIDLGHLRDQADWTAYLYSIILINKKQGKVKLNLGIEGGKKTISVYLSKTMDSLDAIYLAGKIAYDLSVWHEISTWFGASYVPFVPERYSSFSVEDIYSNLMGVTLGIEALKSNLPYEEAMTIFLADKLKQMEVVKTEKETYDAMEATRNIWWTREKSLPSRKILIRHQCEAYPGASPWLIPSYDTINPYRLVLIESTKNGEPLSNFYELKIKLNLIISEKKTVKKYNKKVITQHDFIPLLKEIELEMAEEFKSL